MKKDDLCTGMRVITQSGHPYVFMRGIKELYGRMIDAFIPLVEKSPNGVLYLQYYKDNLQREEDVRQCDNIMEVWEADISRMFQIPDPIKDTLLWSRNTVELTLEDIAKKFKVDVKRIKIVE